MMTDAALVFWTRSSETPTARTRRDGTGPERKLEKELSPK